MLARKIKHVACRHWEVVGHLLLGSDATSLWRTYSRTFVACLNVLTVE